MARKILVLNGPNLNLLGLREPQTYGSTTLADVEALCQAEAAALGLACECRQSNHGGELVTWIQQARDNFEGIVFNPGAYSHTSIAIPDAMRGVPVPVVEVHISNIHARESFRHHSYVSAAALGVICGLGIVGYRLAIVALAEKLKG